MRCEGVSEAERKSSAAVDVFVTLTLRCRRDRDPSIASTLSCMPAVPDGSIAGAREVWCGMGPRLFTMSQGKHVTLGVGTRCLFCTSREYIRAACL